MKTSILKILALLIMAIMILPAAATIAAADDSDDGSPSSGKPGKPDKPDKPNKKDNNVPVVTITAPTATYVEGPYLIITVTVEDEDTDPIASITVDLMPTFNTGNTITVDISGWESNSEHFITAVYEDSGGLIGGDDHYLIKL